MSTKAPSAEKVSGLFTCFADPDVSTGNLRDLCSYLINLLAISDLSDTTKLKLLSDGFFNDILLSAYSEIGIPLDKPYRMGYVSSSVSPIYSYFLSYFLNY